MQDSTVPCKILGSANLPKYENHKKFAQTVKGCNSRSGIIFVQNNNNKIITDVIFKLYGIERKTQQ